MTTNDGDNNADNSNDGEDFLPLPMMATTAELMTRMMGGGGMRETTQQSAGQEAREGHDER